MSAAKYPTSYRLSPDALAALARVAAHHGISQTAALEMMIRAADRALPKARRK